MSSENVEMYLISIAMLAEEGLEGPVPLARLADELSVQVVSVNQMVRKLDEEGLVNYIPYKGVDLTPEGQQRANAILRHRRLWEVFFVDHLEFSPTEAEILACRMEHVTSSEVDGRLSDFLGSPEISPAGKIIPAELNKDEPRMASVTLKDLNVGQQGEILAFQGNKVTTSFLNNEGLYPGVIVQVEAISSSGAILVRTAEKNITITGDIAEKIKVKAVEVIKTYAA